MKLFRLVAVASLAALMSGAIAGAAQADATLDRIKQRGSLVAGVILSGAPFGPLPRPRYPCPTIWRPSTGSGSPSWRRHWRTRTTGSKHATGCVR
ncbi:hypothetical protein J2848_002640 [Azospirillum lipoferum]|nr:hypothetical protein [Azospirillum lipoferum]